MDPQDILRFVDIVYRERGIDKEIVFGAIEQGLLTAARKRFVLSASSGFSRSAAAQLARSLATVGLWSDFPPHNNQHNPERYRLVTIGLNSPSSKRFLRFRKLLTRLCSDAFVVANMNLQLATFPTGICAPAKRRQVSATDFASRSRVNTRSNALRRISLTNSASSIWVKFL